MQSINDIHSRIKGEFAAMQNEYKAGQKAYLDTLYSTYPEIARIDGEISSLALKSARAIIEGTFTEEEAARYVKENAKKLKDEREKLLSKNSIKPYMPDYKCTKCQDTGFLPDGTKCVCYMKKIRDFLSLPEEKGKANILDRASFENFDLSYYPTTKDASLGVSSRSIMKAVYARCSLYANSFSGEGSGNLLLCGPSGLGKTHMAAAVANAVMEKGYLVLYKSSYKLFQFLEDYKFSKISREDGAVIYDTIYSCDLLVIDDFGTEFITSYTQSAFFDLLSTRLDSGKSTILSTNLALEKISDIYQERVMSRLKNEFEVLRFAGEDIRALKNNK